MSQLQKPTILTEQDLPLYCPSAKSELWSSHPRVFLPIEETSEATCPYCGAEFILDQEKTAE